jgi:capsular polysaccharide biosynthesis protein
LEVDSFSIDDLINALKERWQLIACITLMAMIFSTFLSFFVISPKYQASTKLFIGKESDGERSNYNNNDVQMYQKLLKTYADIISTRDLVDEALKDNGIDGNAESVLRSLTVTPKMDTQILVISYISEDKQKSKEIVEAITNRFISKSTEVIKNSDVKVIEKVTLPKSPVSPNKKLNIVIAIIIGLGIGSGLAVVLALLDNTFKDKEQVEKILDLPVLGVIPNSEMDK